MTFSPYFSIIISFFNSDPTFDFLIQTSTDATINTITTGIITPNTIATTFIFWSKELEVVSIGSSSNKATKLLEIMGVSKMLEFPFTAAAISEVRDNAYVEL